jgi:hypothetical protein
MEGYRNDSEVGLSGKAKGSPVKVFADQKVDAGIVFGA